MSKGRIRGLGRLRARLHKSPQFLVWLPSFGYLLWDAATWPVTEDGEDAPYYGDFCYVETIEEDELETKPPDVAGADLAAGPGLRPGGWPADLH